MFENVTPMNQNKKKSK